MTRADGEEKIT